MTWIGGPVRSDVPVDVVLAAILPLGAAAMARVARTRQSPRLRFACYWLLLVYFAGLVTSAALNLRMAGWSGFWATAVAAGVIGLLVTCSRGPELWRAQHDTPPARTFGREASG